MLILIGALRPAVFDAFGPSVAILPTIPVGIMVLTHGVIAARPAEYVAVQELHAFLVATWYRLAFVERCGVVGIVVRVGFESRVVTARQVPQPE